MRLKYESAVAELRDAAAAMLRSGASQEDVARWVVEQRNALKHTYRDLTPAPVVDRIVARTLARYGNAIGPSADQLRAAGKSWRDIIDSASRPGDHGDAFLVSRRSA
ncbi:hemagglutinin [Variovorax sp. J22R24]|uniref:hemagglutinin n=1 Tax=Variovorax gracilis TaxID=3053502 RepID=UPI002578CBCA|nr:hemagglutinin [Variovorax sp. J22R24]MDM0108051.1 hemagglutinin [Variovorax sp. J22R24]